MPRECVLVVNVTTANPITWFHLQLSSLLIFGSEDHAEGMDAFLEKRDPDFAGR